MSALAALLHAFAVRWEPCTRCNASPGTACCSRRGNVIATPHRARVAAYERNHPRAAEVMR